MLSALRQLSLRRDFLRDAKRWTQLTTLHVLTRLELSQCHLQALPSPLSRCTALQSLSLEANWDLEGDWDILRRLQRLTVSTSQVERRGSAWPVAPAARTLATHTLPLCPPHASRDTGARPLPPPAPDPSASSAVSPDAP